MNIYQLRELTKYTKNKEIIGLLLDLDNLGINKVAETLKFVTNNTSSVDEINLKDFTEEIVKTIKGKNTYESVTGSQLEYYFYEIKKIIEKNSTNEEKVELKNVTKLLKFYNDENYTDNSYCFMMNFNYNSNSRVTLDDMKRLYDSLKNNNFKRRLTSSNLENLLEKRSIDEICSIFEIDNKFTEDEIESLYYNTSILSNRSFEENNKLADYVFKIKKSNKLKEEQIKKIMSIISNRNVLQNRNNHEQILLINKFISKPTTDAYELIISDLLLKQRTINEQLELIDICTDKKIKDMLLKLSKLGESEESILSFTDLKKYLVFYSNCRSPFVESNIIDNYKNVEASELINQLEQMEQKIDLKDELYNVASLEDFIKSIEKNNINEFSSKTLVYTSKPIKYNKDSK